MSEKEKKEIRYSLGDPIMWLGESQGPNKSVLHLWGEDLPNAMAVFPGEIIREQNQLKALGEARIRHFLSIGAARVVKDSEEPKVTASESEIKIARDNTAQSRAESKAAARQAAAQNESTKGEQKAQQEAVAAGPIQGDLPGASRS